MNERIDELIKQAGMELKARRPYYANDPTGYLEGDLYYARNNQSAVSAFLNGGSHKLAELIIAEVLKTCQDHPDWTGSMIGEQLKKGFGTE